MTQDIDLATLTSTQGFKVLGAARSDFSGYSVASAGDINGDGYADIIIGAYKADPNLRTDAGTSYVIFGKASGFNDIDLVTLTSTQGFKVLGAASGDWCGFAVSTAGDVNGDGYDDIIIGARYADPNSREDAGTSYVIFGKASGFGDIDLANLISSQGFKVLGAVYNDQLGKSVASAGDINGDGFSDIIIGAPYADEYPDPDPDSFSAAGRSYVIFGKASGFSDIDLASLNLTEGFKILGAASGDNSGFVVSTAGDINGDGYDDIIIGAPYADPNAKSRAGISYIIFGKSSGFSNIDLASLSPTEGFKILGAASDDNSGISVGSAGDINGDGYSDIIIGAWQADPSSRTDAGTSYIIFGKASGFSDIDLASLNLTEGFKILGAASGDYSGWSSELAGDINGDGYSDVIIGAYGADPSARSRAGISYIIFGKSSGFSDVDLATLALDQGFRVLGAASGDSSGFSVGSAGDINGDGYSDIIIGAHNADPNSKTYAGTSYIIFNTVNSNFTPTAVPTSIPSESPTAIPSSGPTANPTMLPSTSPSALPTVAPTAAPSSIPSVSPSSQPTAIPSSGPTASPTMLPSFKPTESPTLPKLNSAVVCYKDNQKGTIYRVDFNGDNKADQICEHYDNTIAVCLSTGGNKMNCIGPLVNKNFPQQPFMCQKDGVSGSLSWADHNGDNKADLFCENYDDSINVCLSTGVVKLNCIGELIE